LAVSTRPKNLVAETFKKTLGEKYPDIKVLDPQEEGFDAAQAIAKATAIIRATLTLPCFLNHR